MSIYILSIWNYLFNFCPFSINQIAISSKRDIVNAKKINIHIFLVHTERENVQETPDFDACLETHFAHTYDAWRTHITHTHDGWRAHGNLDLV